MTTKQSIRMVDADVSTTDGTYAATVQARLTFEVAGTYAKACHTRAVLAAAYRFAADLIEAIEGGDDWTMPSVTACGIGGRRVQAHIAYELVTDTQEEADKILALFHDVIPAPEAV